MVFAWVGSLLVWNELLEVTESNVPHTRPSLLQGLFGGHSPGFSCSVYGSPPALLLSLSQVRI